MSQEMGLSRESMRRGRQRVSGTCDLPSADGLYIYGGHRVDPAAWDGQLPTQLCYAYTILFDMEQSSNMIKFLKYHFCNLDHWATQTE